MRRSVRWLAHRWIGRDIGRRARLLLRFAETEADGGRDLVRAAETTSDPVLRRLYLRHAADERRHADLLRARGRTLMRASPASGGASVAPAAVPGGHGLDDLDVRQETDGALLAFLHVSEKTAVVDLAVHRDLLRDDPATRAVFEQILRDEEFHVNYTLAQLARVSPRHHRRLLWRARLKRLWRAYLRVAAALGGALGSLVLIVLYFVLLPAFALLARRAQRRERLGWVAIDPARRGSLKSQY
jgi:hypothetical protein